MPDYDVAGSFDYQPVKGDLEDFQAKALQNRPDLRAAQQGVTAANSQHELQKAIGKRDVTGQISYTHLGYQQRCFAVWANPTAHLRSQPGRDRTHRLCDYAGAGAGEVRERAGADRCERRIRKLRANDRLFPSIAPAISMKRSNPGTSLSTPTSMARPACLIFSMQSAAIALRNSATGRRSHHTCSRWNSFAKP